MVDAPSKNARIVKIADLKRQIAAGTYDSPERLEEALGHFLDEQLGNKKRQHSDSPNHPK